MKIQITLKSIKKNIKNSETYFRKYNPISYKGISRNPLSAVPGDKFDAMNRIIEKYNYDISDTDMDLLPSADDLKIVYDALENKSMYEIIKVYRDEHSINSMTIGFDIGYWGSDHFSLIADTIVTPMWHGPIEEDYKELRKILKRLNNNLLFKSYLDANKFREFYRSKSWGETESYEDEFCIIGIDGVRLPS